MSNITSLIDMKINEEGRVVEVQGGWSMTQKLDALGVRVGAEIRKLNQQFMGGPVLVEVGDMNKTQVAIGFGMASKVLVDITGKGR